MAGSVIGATVRGATGGHGVVAGIRCVGEVAWKCNGRKKGGHVNVKVADVY